MASKAYKQIERGLKDATEQIFGPFTWTMFYTNGSTIHIDERTKQITVKGDASFHDHARAWLKHRVADGYTVEYVQKFRRKITPRRTHKPPKRKE